MCFPYQFLFFFFFFNDTATTEIYTLSLHDALPVSRGQATQCRLDEQQLAALDAVLDAGPLAAGWTGQRWTLARVRDLVAAKFKVQYTVPGIWYLPRRRGWTCQIGARRAIERDDGAVEAWKKETWPRIKAPRRPSAAGSSSKTSAASR